MSANLIDIISKSSSDYVHNVSTLKSKKLNDSSKYQGINQDNKEDKFGNSGSFYDLLKKKKSNISKSNRNIDQKEKSKIKKFLIFY